MNDKQELVVKIETEGGALALTPESLLHFYLPGAKLVPGRDDVYQGTVTTQQGSSIVYLHKATMVGALMDCREKHLNPISDIYILPANGPDKRSGHKIRYEVGVQRARRLPGFLGLNMGLLVKRGQHIVETAGEMALEGDVIVGAWAELYIAGLPRPLRKEVSKKEFWGVSKIWSEKGGFMLCKVALDHLRRTNYPTLYAAETAQDTDADMGEIVLEASTEASASGEPRNGFTAGTLYTGAISALTFPKKEPRRPGSLTLRTAQGDLMAWFWSRPAALKQVEDARHVLGREAGLSFVDKPDKTGKNWRYIETLDLAPEADEPTVIPPAAQPDQGELI